MSETERIRLLIVDDHRLVRDGLALLLSTFDEFEVVGMAHDGEQAVALCRRLEPDVVLMDMVMPNMDGPMATAQLLVEQPDIKVIALTSFVEDALVQRSIGAGAVGYLLKNVSPEQLAGAIRDAHAGRPTIGAEAAQALIRFQSPVDRPDYDLSDRELEVLQLIVDGQPNKAIAGQLNLSPTTVRGYVSQILAKLGVRNRTEAATKALQEEILV